MSAQIISFSEKVNERRAAAENKQREQARQQREQERIQGAANEGFNLGKWMDQSDDDALVLAAKMAMDEAEKVAEEKRASDTNPFPAYCSPDNEFRGSKYEATADLSLKEVAKRIRGDIRDMIKAGTLPNGIKVSVRMDGYIALRIAITALPDGFRVYNPEYVRASKNFSQPADRHNGFVSTEYTPAFQQIIDALDSNTQSYNRDNSDSMSDYFDVRFYDGRAGLHWEYRPVVQEREAVDLGDQS